MKNIFTVIEIKAPLEVVWNALADFADYSSWNTLIAPVNGVLAEGCSIKIRISPPGRKSSPYRVRIVKIERGRELKWKGRFGCPGLIDGLHAFQLYKIDDEVTRVVQRESFSGLLVPFVWRTYLNTSLRQGFEASNLGLKRYLEQRLAVHRRICSDLKRPQGDGLRHFTQQ
jgi:hypothetical protein